MRKSSSYIFKQIETVKTENIPNAMNTQDLQKEVLGRLNVELKNPAILTESIQETETKNEEDLTTKSEDEEFKG